MYQTQLLRNMGYFVLWINHLQGRQYLTISTCRQNGRFVTCIYYNNRTQLPLLDGYSVSAESDLCEVEVYGNLMNELSATILNTLL